MRYWLFALLVTACGCSEDSGQPVTTVVPEPVRSAVEENPNRRAVEENPSRRAVEEKSDRGAAVEGNAEVVPHTVEEVPGELPAESHRGTSEKLRLADDRPPFDEARLSANGIHVLRSRRLILLTDLSPDSVQDLPRQTDELFETLEKQLGPLPPAADGSEFQVTGCLMAARDRFEACELLPSEDLPIKHGRHFNYRFWMLNPDSDYYRRHLLFHEFVHCFMTCEGGMNDIPELWYTEGIAEYFATHQLSSAATSVQFGVLPSDIELFRGWGRISEIRRSYVGRPDSDIVSAGFVALDSMLYPETNRFDQDSQYAHAWALVWYLFSNPRWTEFQEHLKPLRKRLEFEQAVATLSKPDEQRLAVEWLLFLDSLCEGYETQHAFPDWGEADFMSEREVEGSSDESTTASTIEVRLKAAGAWQCIPVVFDQGEKLTLTASGTAVFGTQPKPWVSEPDGITFDYYRGRPIGEVIAIFVARDGAWASRRIPVGRQASIEIPADGFVWLQANESSAHRSDNSGGYTVMVEVLKP